MLKIVFHEEDITALRYGRFHHPDPRVQGRREALYWRSHGVANAAILRLWGSSNASFHRFLQADVAGGVEQLKRIDHDRPQSARATHRPTREADVQQHPPATVAEAAARIAELTGMVRQPTQGRQVLRGLGRKPLKVGMIPAKADVEAQEALKKTTVVNRTPAARKVVPLPPETRVKHDGQASPFDADRGAAPDDGGAAHHGD